MCVAAFAWEAHPRWRIVAIGNRDEFHERAAAPLARWEASAPGTSGIIAGRDLSAGGTWLGVSERGRFALVTNLRGFGERAPGMASRGQLVTDLLTGSGPYGDPDTADLAAFNPFNLLIADTRSARFLTNRPQAVRTALAHGIYGLSNGTLDEPWPKTLHLKAALLDWLGNGSDDLAPLFKALASERIGAIGLHETEPSDVPAEPAETPPFIRNPVYGTRCSTVVAIGRDGQGRIVERRYTGNGEAAGETAVEFAWGN